MNNITIELCAEDRARLDNILNVLKDTTLELVRLTDKAATKAAATEKPEPKAKQEAPAKAEPVEQPKEAPAPEPKAEAAPAPEVSAAELQSKVVQLVSAGKKTETRAIVMEYAKSVGEIPAEKRAEVLERLKALEG